MKTAFIWMKNNPIAVVAVILCVISFLVLVVVRFQASSFMKEMEKRNKVVQTIKTLKSTRVKIPSPDLDISVEERDITINEPAIESLKQVYRSMEIEFNNIFALAVDLNRKGHDPILDGLFPDYGTRSDKLYDSRGEYLKAFESMLLHYSPTDIYPRLNAGGPVDLTQISTEVAIESKNFKLRLGLEDATDEMLTPEQREDLEEARLGAVYRVMKQYASKYHIYVANPRDYASLFQIGAWSDNTHSPELYEIWEGQMELWVQQDIVQAIGTANNIWDSSFNVLRNPIKKLQGMSIVPGYVGISTTGGVTSTGKLTPGQEASSGDVRLPNGFLMTPTGRRSNSIYDVIHAKLTLIVDYQQLPKVYEAFGKTNFMTILNCQIIDVDEYEALKQGYLYGPGDCVQIELIIETLWLRDWTVRLMPDRIKKTLAIPIPEKE